MKKVFSFVLAVMLVASLLAVTAFADGTTVVAGETVKASAGETVTVGIYISNNAGFDSAKMTVSCGAPLTITNITKGLMTGEVNLAKGIINHASGTDVTANGALFYVEVAVAADAQPGTYPVNLSVTRLNSHDESLEFTYSGGAVVIECDHVYGDWYTVTEPDCDDTGLERRDCSKCDHYETRVIPALGHSPKAAVKENVVAADCVNDGSYDSVVYCSVCNEELSRDTVIVPATGHTYGDWMYNDEIHWHECSVCGEHCDHEGEHDLYYKELPGGKPATATEPGYARFQCYCGYTWEMYLAPNPDLDPDIPPTGDITDTLTAGTAAILVTMMGTVALVVKRKTAK